MTLNCACPLQISLLAGLMYPDAAWEDLANDYDQVYSPALRIYWEAVQPILDQLDELSINPVGNTLADIIDRLSENPELLMMKLQVTQNVLLALDILVPDFSSGILATQAAVALILNSVAQRTPPSIASDEVVLLLYLLGSILDSLSEPGDLTMYFSLAQTDSTERIRGGFIGNYSIPFNILTPGTVAARRNEILQSLVQPFQFKQYIILGDGNTVGSTAVSSPEVLFSHFSLLTLTPYHALALLFRTHFKQR